jgi:hypothetical protein
MTATRARRRPKKAATPGVVMRHSRWCNKLAGGRCNCNPAYQANLWNAKEGRRERQTFTGGRAEREAARWRKRRLEEIATSRRRAASKTASKRSAPKVRQRPAQAKAASAPRERAATKEQSSRAQRIANRVEYADFLPLVEPHLPKLQKMVAAVGRKRGQLPCTKQEWKRSKCGRPKAHETCGSCFSFHACADVTCDHPACKGVTWRRFADAFRTSFPELDVLDVRMERTKAQPLERAGRIPELLRPRKRDRWADVKQDAEAGRRLLELLGEEWRQGYDFPIAAERVFPGELWIAKHKPGLVQSCGVRYASSASVALMLAAGDDPLAGNRGGTHTTELRLRPEPNRRRTA